MSAAYFKTIRSILKGCLTCPHRCQNSTLNPQVASFPSVWTSHTHFKCNCRLVQRSQEEVGRAVSSFKGSALPGAGKNAGSGHTPLFFGIRITMGTRDLTMSKQCPRVWSLKPKHLGEAKNSQGLLSLSSHLPCAGWSSAKIVSHESAPAATTRVI